MQKSRFITRAVMCCTALSSVVASPAFAAVTLLDPVPAADPADLTPANLALAQTQCDAAAVLADADGSAPESDRYSAEVVEGAVTQVGSTTESGTHSLTDAIGDPVGAGTFTPAHLEILGDPYRNGGSVNMFGIQQTVGGFYSASSYDFEGTFKTTYAHAYTCDISKEVYHAPVFVPGHKVRGYYINFDFGQGQGNDNDEGGEDGGQPQGSCLAHNNTGDSLPFWGTDTNQCKFIVTEPATVDETIPAYFDDAEFVANVAGGSFDQDQTDVLLAHEDFGEGFSTSETLIIGQVVVCISPSTTVKKLPGAWTAKNGYSGVKCTTTWYNTGATVGVPNLNDGSHNWVTIPLA